MYTNFDICEICALVFHLTFQKRLDPFRRRSLFGAIFNIRGGVCCLGDNCAFVFFCVVVFDRTIMLDGSGGWKAKRMFHRMILDGRGCLECVDIIKHRG